MDRGDRTHLFLLSGKRSGSTLTTLLLGGHPQCVSVGETWKISRPRFHKTPCTCGVKPVTDCPFWSAVGKRLEQTAQVNPFTSPGRLPASIGDLASWRRVRLWLLRFGIRNGPLAAMLRLYAKDPLARKLARNSGHVLDATLDVSGKQIAIESCKNPLGAWTAYRMRPDTTRVIHLVRDGRGVMSSYLGLSRVHSEPKADGPREATKLWLKENQSIRRVIEVLPAESRLTLRYEDLCADPAAKLQEILRFLRLDYSDDLLKFRDYESHNFSGNRMRLAADSEIRLDEAWRRNCSQEVLAEFEQVGGAFNRSLGYAD